jgi:hypothetical protein
VILLLLEEKGVWRSRLSAQHRRLHRYIMSKRRGFGEVLEPPEKTVERCSVWYYQDDQVHLKLVSTCEVFQIHCDYNQHLLHKSECLHDQDFTFLKGNKPTQLNEILTRDTVISFFISGTFICSSWDFLFFGGRAVLGFELGASHLLNRCS